MTNDACLKMLPNAKVWALTTKARGSHSDASFSAGDILLFGPETRGLPVEVRETIPQQQWLKLPMVADSRSLNLSNACAITVYEAWRQLDYQNSL